MERSKRRPPQQIYVPRHRRPEVASSEPAQVPNEDSSTTGTTTASEKKAAGVQPMGRGRGRGRARSTMSVYRPPGIRKNTDSETVGDSPCFASPYTTQLPTTQQAGDVVAVEVTKTGTDAKPRLNTRTPSNTDNDSVAKSSSGNINCSPMDVKAENCQLLATASNRQASGRGMGGQVTDNDMSGQMADCDIGRQLADSDTSGQLADSDAGGQMADSDTSGQVADSDTGGQVAGSDTSGQVAGCDAGGQVADSDTSGQVLDGDTSGQVADCDAGGQVADCDAGGQVTDSDTGGQVADSDTGGQVADSGTGGQMAGGDMSGQVVEGDMSGQVVEGDMSGQVVEGGMSEDDRNANSLTQGLAVSAASDPHGTNPSNSVISAAPSFKESANVSDWGKTAKDESDEVVSAEDERQEVASNDAEFLSSTCVGKPNLATSYDAEVPFAKEFSSSQKADQTLGETERAGADNFCDNDSQATDLKGSGITEKHHVTEEKNEKEIFSACNISTPEKAGENGTNEISISSPNKTKSAEDCAVGAEVGQATKQTKRDKKKKSKTVKPSRPKTKTTDKPAKPFSAVNSPKSADKSFTAVNSSKSADSDAVEEESWDCIFNDEGECLEEDVLKELNEKVGEVKISKPVIDYLEYTPKDPEMDDSKYSHMVELYDFSSSFKTEDLTKILGSAGFKDFDIKWVDDTHAIAIFATFMNAEDALTYEHPMLKMRCMAKASRAAKVKVKSCSEFMQPFKERPVTVARTARRLLASSLGISPVVSEEKKKQENQILKDAKLRVREQRVAKANAWDGVVQDDSPPAPDITTPKTSKRTEVGASTKKKWDGSFGKCAMDG